MKNSIAIIGAGLIGRLIALSLTRQGYTPTLIDKDHKNAHNSAAYAAAGLLTPLGEAIHCEPNIVQMGMESLKLWPTLLATLEGESFFQQEGSIMVSHSQDQGDYLQFARYIKTHYPQHRLTPLNRIELEALEPDLGRAFNQGLFLPEEGQINNRKLLTALASALNKADINWLSHTEVVEIKSTIDNTQISYKAVKVEAESNESQAKPFEKDKIDEYLTQAFDLVIDCRGTGAKPESIKDNAPNQKISNTSALTDLRAVRGELFHLFAPNVNISRPIRLMHPRYQLYIAPKGDGDFVVGATEIESDDMSPITVRSAMELLSAAYSVHPGFAEANITQHINQCRPAFSNNQPKIIVNNHTIHVNGLYRHGFLIAPVVLAQVNELVGMYNKNNSLQVSKDSHFDFSTLRYAHLVPVTSGIN